MALLLTGCGAAEMISCRPSPLTRLHRHRLARFNQGRLRYWSRLISLNTTTTFSLLSDPEMRLIGKVLIGLFALALTLKAISWFNLGETIFKILFLFAFIVMALFGLANQRDTGSQKGDDETWRRALWLRRQREDEQRRKNNE